MKYKIKTIIFVIVIMISLFCGINVKGFAINDGATSETLNGITVNQSIEWISKDKAEYTVNLYGNQSGMMEYETVTLVVFNVSDYMSSDDVMRYKASLLKFANKAINSNKLAIMDEATYLELLNSGESAYDYFYDTSNISYINYIYPNIVNAPLSNQQLVKSISQSDVSSLYPGDSSTAYSVIYINTFPQLDNAISLNNVSNSEEDNVENIYYSNYSLCDTYFSYSFQYVNDASNYNDSRYIDFNTLPDKIYNASWISCQYYSFMLDFYYNSNYFELESINDISVTDGIVSIETTESFNEEPGEEYIQWDLKKLKMIANNTLKVTFSLKNLDTSADDYCSNDKGCSVDSDGIMTYNVVSNVMTKYLDYSYYKYKYYDNYPVLHDKYWVYYKTDSDVCSISPNENTAAKLYSVFDPVTIDDSDYSCNNNMFIGWIYPKSLNDKVYYIPRLGSTTLNSYNGSNQLVYYNDIQKVNDDVFLMPSHNVYLLPVWENVSLSKYFSNTDINVQSSENSIANYYDPGSDILFAGNCWKMMAKDTSYGILLLYDGEPDANGMCSSDRTNHGGANGKTSINLSDEYYYASGYTYDNVTKKYTLNNDLVKTTWSNATSNDLIGKYTCKSDIAMKPCDEMYYIADYNSESSAYVVKYNSEVNYAEIGVSSYNSNNNAEAYTMYYYSDPLEFNSFSMLGEQDILLKMPFSDSYYYGDSISYVSNYYNLNNADLISNVSNREDLIGTYTFFSNDSTHTDDEVYYIAGVDDDYIYYLQLYDGEELNDIEETYYFSNDASWDSTNNIYVLANPVEVKNTEWFTSNFTIGADSTDDYLMCKGSSTCSDVNVVSVNYKNQSELGYFRNYTYGEDITYDDATDTYTLVNTYVGFLSNSLVNDVSGFSFDLYQYTCMDNSNSCENVYFVRKIANDYMMALLLEDGALIDNEYEPKYDSDIKKVVDAWYKNYLIDYQDYIVDVWNDEWTRFYPNYVPTYPISIFGYARDIFDIDYEYLLSNSKFTTGHDYWIGNPNTLEESFTSTAFATYVDANGQIVNSNLSDDVTAIKGVRPVIVISNKAKVRKNDDSNTYKIDDGYEY